MKIKLDENLPTEAGDVLLALGHLVDTVIDEGLRGHTDSDIWLAAQSEGRFLITQDMDFSDARKYRPGDHAGILLVRLREPTRRRLIERLTDVLKTNDLSEWERCLVVLSESRVRVRKPAQ